MDISQTEKQTFLSRPKEWPRLLYRAIRTHLYYNLIYYPVARKKKSHAERDIPKNDEHTYTAFYRSPGQLSLLTGPVMQFLSSERSEPLRELTVNIVAGSNGAEAYTMASVLMNTFPELDLKIYSSDLHDSTVAAGKAGIYDAQEVNSLLIPAQFISDTFDFKNNQYHVKERIKEKITFFKANIVSDDLTALYPKADILCIQNVLFHLEEKEAYAAYTNAIKTVKKKSVIFMDGMSLDMRLKLVNKYHLSPFTENLKLIHQHARRHIPEDWWNYYYGLEPFLFFMPKKAKRYGTVFGYDVR